MEAYHLQQQVIGVHCITAAHGHVIMDNGWILFVKFANSSFLILINWTKQGEIIAWYIIYNNDGQLIATVLMLTREKTFFFFAWNLNQFALINMLSRLL